MIKKNTVLLALMVLTSTVVFAQQQNSNASGSTTTSAQPSIKEQVLTAQASSVSREMRLELLKSIESGAVTMDADVIKILGRLAGDGTIYRDTIAHARMDNTDIRMRAIYALCKAGGEDARHNILNALDSEADPNVKGVAFIALGDMGYGNDPSTVRVMNSAMLRDMATNRSSSAAIDYLTAMAKLVTAANADAETVEVLMQLSDGESGYNSQVRTTAMDYLRSLWK